MDVAITMSSFISELIEKKPKINVKDLNKSIKEIGKDILFTTANILLFAFLGEFMTLLIWFKSYPL